MSLMGSSITALRIGDWHVDPILGQISRNGETARVEARTLRLLLVLAERPGETVSIEELLDRVWAGVVVTPDSVYQAVATLRRLLGDDSKQPRYIATVPRLGYRMVAAVVGFPQEAKGPTGAPGPSVPEASGLRDKPVRSRHLVVTMEAVVAGFALVVGLILLRASDSLVAPGRSQLSVGVAPFVDLTPSMDQEQLADEVTEGVADRLSRNPALHTPGFRSSYYLIGKTTNVAEVGRILAVAYVVDGSVRRSGDTIRIAARLVRADSGLVIWSQVFEQPLRSLDIAQDNIARAVAAALTKVAARTG